MKSKENGYVVMTPCHPYSGRQFLFHNTFRAYRRDAIAAFLQGTNETWETMRKKYNYKCVKATCTITTNE